MQPGNRRLDDLTAYPFSRLRALLADLPAPPDVDIVDLTVGEPKLPPPSLLTETLAANAGSWNRYAPITGTVELRGAAAAWLQRRYALPDGLIDPERMILPLAGTREGLFMTAQAVLPQEQGVRAAVAMPEPGYAVYEGAAVMAGGDPLFLPALAEKDFLPDLHRLASAPDDIRLIYLCSPTNPQGSIADLGYLRRALAVARDRGAVLAVDECYGELYRDAPAPGILEIAAETGSVDGLLVFHSLSKRSSAAGLRGGIVTGDPDLIDGLKKMRAFAAAGASYALYAAAIALWQDDDHVDANRQFYNRNFIIARECLKDAYPDPAPRAGFFLWLPVADDEAISRQLWRDHAIRVLPGRYLGRSGAGYVRIALVYPEEILRPALSTIADVLNQGNRS